MLILSFESTKSNADSLFTYVNDESNGIWGWQHMTNWPVCFSLLLGDADNIFLPWQNANDIHYQQKKACTVCVGLVLEIRLEQERKSGLFLSGKQFGWHVG